MNTIEIESERNAHTATREEGIVEIEPRIVLASSMCSSHNQTEYINWKNISFLYLVLLIFPEHSLNLRLTNNTNREDRILVARVSVIKRICYFFHKIVVN